MPSPRCTPRQRGANLGRHGHHFSDVAEPTPRTTGTTAELTIRDVFGRYAIWDAVVSAVLDEGLESSDLDLAGRLSRYLDRPAGESPRSRRQLPGGHGGLRSQLQALL